VEELILTLSIDIIMKGSRGVTLVSLHSELLKASKKKELRWGNHRREGQGRAKESAIMSYIIYDIENAI